MAAPFCLTERNKTPFRPVPSPGRTHTPQVASLGSPALSNYIQRLKPIRGLYIEYSRDLCVFRVKQLLSGRVFGYSFPQCSI